MLHCQNKNIFIIHFQPLERYPPVMNLITYLEENTNTKVFVLCTKINRGAGLKIFDSDFEKVRIIRSVGIDPVSSLRLFNYLRFYLSGLFLLIRFRPKSVLYFESLSSWPALIYKRFISKNVKLFVHYHEYSSPVDYNNNMRLVKWMHKMEVKLYPLSYEWISQTNSVRIQLFRNDNNLNKITESIFHIMPNYPSKSWNYLKEKKYSQNKTKRLVFVGSLGYENMYLQEVIDWLQKHKDKFTLDVYSYNIDEKAKRALENYGFENIRYCGGCDYQNLPELLRDYDIGLDIYKPFALNHINGASNKVFEYLACGLDVWFSEDMTYTFQYKRENVYPKVVSVNFNKLDDFDFLRAISREGLKYSPSEYFYENIYGEIEKNMVR